MNDAIHIATHATLIKYELWVIDYPSFPYVTCYSAGYIVDTITRENLIAENSLSSLNHFLGVAAFERQLRKVYSKDG